MRVFERDGTLLSGGAQAICVSPHLSNVTIAVSYNYIQF